MQIRHNSKETAMLRNLKRVKSRIFSALRDNSIIVYLEAKMCVIH